MLKTPRSSPRCAFGASVFLVAFASIGSVPALAQAGGSVPPGQEDADVPAEVERTLRIEPASLELQVGETAQLTATVVGPDGAVEEAELMFFSRSRRSVTVGRSDGLVTAVKPGSFEVIIRERRQDAGENQEGRAKAMPRLSGTIPVVILPPPMASLEILAPAAGFFAGTSAALSARAMDEAGSERTSFESTWSVEPSDVAVIDQHGELLLHGVGTALVQLESEGHVATRSIEVAANPVARLEIVGDLDAPRTGDVIHFTVAAFDGAGEPVQGVPVELSFRARPTDTLGPGATGQLEPMNGADQGWRFVAEAPGRYGFVASSGNAAARASVSVVERKVGGKFSMVGHGPVRDTHTSDLWVWEGTDGRDYAVTGTWGGNGDAHFWDVTDPANMERVATVNIDARTVNDVKVSADGRTCILSREGASNRKNGIVIVDVTDPRNPKIKTGFDDDLTGGVHNVFIDQNKVYALSAGARYDVIDVADGNAPRRVGTYKVNAPSPSIHDLWVEDGLAYSSNWSDGVHIVDVGNGMAGGSPTNPVMVSSYAYPSGWNHAAFPFRQEDTGLFYVAAGDEAFPLGLNLTGKPTYPRGWIHFLDFTDMENPRETARYEVPEAGTHNIWVDGDVMYVAYYNAGLRAVDVSGELMGNLYDQGREIAWFLTDDPEGYISNAPMVWGPQPHKGHVFFSDWNSGLWAAKLER